MHHVYNTETGFFTGSALHTDNALVDIQELVRANFGDGFAGMSNVTDHRSQRVDLATGKLVNFEPAIDPNANRAAALIRIGQLEASQHRPLREFTLDPTDVQARDRLHAIEAEIAALRAAL